MTGSGEVFHINTRKVSGEQSEVLALSEAAEARAREAMGRYPQKRSAIMPLLYIAQEELGHIDQRGVAWVSARLELPPMQVWEVATFYTMYYKKPVGTYHVQVCRTLPCALSGARAISEFVQKRLGLKAGEVTPDGMWSFEEVECLGSCGTAPMCQINDHFFENLTDQRLEEIFSRIEREKPDLRLSTVRDTMGTGLEGYPKSQIR